MEQCKYTSADSSVTVESSATPRLHRQWCILCATAGLGACGGADAVRPRDRTIDLSISQGGVIKCNKRRYCNESNSQVNTIAFLFCFPRNLLARAASPIFHSFPFLDQNFLFLSKRPRFERRHLSYFSLFLTCGAAGRDAFSQNIFFQRMRCDFSFFLKFFDLRRRRSNQILSYFL